MDRNKALHLIKNMDEEELRGMLSEQKLSADRESLLISFIQDNTGSFMHEVPHVRLDVEEYALKCLLKEDQYNHIVTKEHPYSKGEHYEYDPQKNEQNIIKHGLSFLEVAESKDFGEIFVEVAGSGDKRFVILNNTNMKHKNKGSKLLPCRPQDENHTLAIASSIDNKFRFISAHFTSSKNKKYEKTISQAIRKGFPDNQEIQPLINRCVELFEQRIIRQ